MARAMADLLPFRPSAEASSTGFAADLGQDVRASAQKRRWDVRRTFPQPKSLALPPTRAAYIAAPGNSSHCHHRG